MIEVILGIMKRATPARHPIQNKFARLYGQLAELKENNKRLKLACMQDRSVPGVMEFMGSISPVRIPEFEADLDRLSGISSPAGGEFMEVGKLYGDGIGLASISIEHVHCLTNEYLNEYKNKEISLNYENEFKIEIPCDRIKPLLTPNNSENISINHQNFHQTNFPTVISPMKRPFKDIEADSKNEKGYALRVQLFIPRARSLAHLFF